MDHDRQDRIDLLGDLGVAIRFVLGDEHPGRVGEVADGILGVGVGDHLFGQGFPEVTTVSRQSSG